MTFSKTLLRDIVSRSTPHLPIIIVLEGILLESTQFKQMEVMTLTDSLPCNTRLIVMTSDAGVARGLKSKVHNPLRPSTFKYVYLIFIVLLLCHPHFHICYSSLSLHYLFLPPHPLPFLPFPMFVPFLLAFGNEVKEITLMTVIVGQGYMGAYWPNTLGFIIMLHYECWMCKKPIQMSFEQNLKIFYMV